MKKKLFTLTVFLALAACGEVGKKNATATLVLQDGTKVSLEGALIKEAVKPNTEGVLKVHEFRFSNGSEFSEGTVYAEFKKLGYSRKIIYSANSDLKVHYYKKDHPVVGSVYQDGIAPDKSSQLSMYWQSK